MQRNCIFPGRYAPLTYYEGKYAISLHTCISITDKAKINEQNTSIAVGLFYIGTYFERFGHSYLKMWPFRTLRSIGP